MQIGDRVIVVSTGAIGTIVAIGDGVSVKVGWYQVCIDGKIFMPWHRSHELWKIS